MSIRWTLPGPLAKGSPPHYEPGRAKVSNTGDLAPFPGPSRMRALAALRTMSRTMSSKSAATPPLSLLAFIALLPGIAYGQSNQTLIDIHKGTSPIGLGSPSNPIPMASKFFFTASDPTHGEELWVSDGTALGTYLLKDIRPGPNSSSISFHILNNNMLFFSADDGVHRWELWVSDGSLKGTYMIDLYPTKPANPTAFQSLGNKVVFLNYQRGDLWVSDGTTNGTKKINNIQFAQYTSPPFKGYVFFSGKNKNTGYKWNLFRTDGSLTGTTQISTAAPLYGSYAATSNLLFYFAFHSTYGSSLWVTDGTSTGTRFVKKVIPSIILPRRVPSLFPVGTKVFFAGYDGKNGAELWVSDGTTSGTHLVKDINPGYRSSDPSYFTRFGNRIVFSAFTPTAGSEPWISDGTASGTFMLKDINPGSGSSDSKNYTFLNNRILFSAASPTTGAELWTSDGTPQGTRLLADLFPGNGSSSPSNFIVYKNRILFSANNPSYGRELWTTDGTPSGTKVLDLTPGTTGTNPYSFFPFQGLLYFFSINNSSKVYNIWRTDGTVSGSKMIPTGNHSFPGSLTAHWGRVFCFADDGSNGGSSGFVVGWASLGERAG